MNKAKLFTLTIPSIFFSAGISLAFYSAPFHPLHLVLYGIIALLLLNIKWQQMWLSRLFGVLFTLLSCYMMLAVYSDYINEKDGPYHWVGFVIFGVSLGMAVLMSIGFTLDDMVKGEM